MKIEEIQKKKKEIEEKFGPWTAHDINLGDGISTMNVIDIDAKQFTPKVSDELTSKADAEKSLYLHAKDASRWEGQSPTSSRVKRIVQIVSDICQKPWENLRVLDLACLEGGFSIEFALRGASVLGIEGREAHIAKAKFVKGVLSLTNVDFIQDDVRNISSEKYGHFDVVLCLGILYHLDSPDVFLFIEKIAEICDHLVVIDTEISLVPEQACTYKGNTYWGTIIKEHESTVTQEEKLKNLWMSLDNSYSFVFTRFSLFNFFQKTGFSSVYECAIPPVLGCGTWATFVAIKGESIEQALISPGEQGVEEYMEIGSRRNDSELHTLISHPYVRLGLTIRRFLKEAQKKFAPRR
jgi:SAM-dependent methyltransferase